MLIDRRKLPQIQNEGHPIFLTWRLHGSVPVCVLDRDTSGPRWLGDIRIAAVVAEAIAAGANVRGIYELHAWVIMPNHVHLLITPAAALPSITRWLKGSTGYKANQLLGLTGQPFWRQESRDRWVRDITEFNKTIRYIEHNPVSAGFVDRVEGWRWSSGYRAGASAYPT